MVRQQGPEHALASLRPLAAPLAEMSVERRGDRWQICAVSRRLAALLDGDPASRPIAAAVTKHCAAQTR